MDAYPGSPSLSAEARDKVLQTFRHTLQLALDGRNEEALLGCDFLLKMDARFQPARSLLEALRGVPVGEVIDLQPFAAFQSVEAAGNALPEDPLPELEEAPPPPPVTGPTPLGTRKPESLRPAGGLDDLVFDDLASADPFAGPSPFGPQGAPPPMAPAPLAPAPPQPEPPPPLSAGGDEFSFAMLSGAPPPAAPPAAPSPHAPGPGPQPGPAAGRGATASPSVDPRIAQFLKSGDETFARGNVQEAIDLWSRVFLIDLSNEEASRRIDGAREAQAAAARRIDVLLSEGVHLFESGDLAGARNKFLGALAVSENDSTARSYLSQIDASLSPQASRPGSGFEVTADTEGDLGAPHAASLGDAEGESLEGALADKLDFDGEEEFPVVAKRASGPVRRGLDVRVVLGFGLLALVAAGAGTFWYLRNHKPSPAVESRVAAPPQTRPKALPSKEDLLARAKGLFDQGKVEEAIQALLSVPDNDPRHNEALTKIDQYRSAAAPAPQAANPTAAGVDEFRISGMAALRASKYIDAVKALDRVVRARPDDLEAAQALTRAREQVDALRSAVKSYNEGDYESAIKLLWELRKGDEKNQDVEEYLLNSYYNNAIQAFQAGNMPKATLQLQEAVQIRPGDGEAQRLLKFAKKYAKGATDLLSKVFIKHLTIRP
jgi:tetratricopeptide (TPR) repeat protein